MKALQRTPTGLAFPGDITQVSTWSGTPYHFWKAAQRKWGQLEVSSVSRNVMKPDRLCWMAKQLLKGRGTRGYYSTKSFVDTFEEQFDQQFFSQKLIAFTPHFPRSETVHSHGGKVFRYIDSTFAELASQESGYFTLEKSVLEDCIALERENLESSEYVIGMSRWATQSILHHSYSIQEKSLTITGGVNLETPRDWRFPSFSEGAGITRDLILGFVGIDWKRKGLLQLIKIQEILNKMGIRARIRAIGNAPKQLRTHKGIEFLGLINKREQTDEFIAALSSCDLGCMFSSSEAFGISPLEFLHLGVPIVGYNHQGCSDTHPPDASFLFPTTVTASTIAETLADSFVRDQQNQISLRNAAQTWSPHLTWDRCIQEWTELLQTGTIQNPLRLWKGIEGNPQIGPNS